MWETLKKNLFKYLYYIYKFLIFIKYILYRGGAGRVYASPTPNPNPKNPRKNPRSPTPTRNSKTRPDPKLPGFRVSLSGSGFFAILIHQLAKELLGILCLKIRSLSLISLKNIYMFFKLIFDFLNQTTSI